MIRPLRKMTSNPLQENFTISLKKEARGTTTLTKIFQQVGMQNVNTDHEVAIANLTTDQKTALEKFAQYLDIQKSTYARPANN
jgi:hypothetical protein